MLRVRRDWAPARLCTSDGWVNDLEEDVFEGEDTDEDGWWTEEDEETLQLEYLDSDSCAMCSRSQLGSRTGCSNSVSSRPPRLRLLPALARSCVDGGHRFL